MKQVTKDLQVTKDSVLYDSIYMKWKELENPYE